MPIPAYARERIALAALSAKADTCCSRAGHMPPSPKASPEETDACRPAGDGDPIGMVLTALSCQGITSWLLVAVPCTLRSHPDWRPTPPLTTEPKLPHATILPQGRSLDVETPPPKLA